MKSLIMFETTWSNKTRLKEINAAENAELITIMTEKYTYQLLVVKS